MKTLHKTIVGGICCITFGILDFLIAQAEYEHRIYVYRYVDSGCKPGSSCPFPAMNEHLIWLGITLIIIGSFLISYRLVKHGIRFRK